MKLIKVEGIEKEVYKIRKNAFYSPDDNKVYLKSDDGIKPASSDAAKKLLSEASEAVDAFKKLVGEVAGKLGISDDKKKDDDDEDGGFF